MWPKKEKESGRTEEQFDPHILATTNQASSAYFYTTGNRDIGDSK
jgi:hypothetical protein